MATPSRVLRLVASLALVLALGPGCDGEGGALSDLPPGPDGMDAPDAPPLGAVGVARGDLDGDAARWNALGRTWVRANAAAIQAVIATNSVLYRDPGSLGMDPFRRAVLAANGAAGILATAGTELAAEARAILGKAGAFGIAAEAAAPIALSSREARDVTALAELGDALAAEAARVQSAFAAFPVTEGSDARDPELVSAALATLRAATPIALLAGPVPVAAGYAAGARAPADGSAGLLDVTSASLAASRIGGTIWLPATMGDDLAAGPVPFVGEPASAWVLRGDDRGPEPADRLVGVEAPADPSLAEMAVALAFADAKSADATVSPIAAGRACFVPGNVADATSCDAAAAGLLSEGWYEDPDTGASFQSLGIAIGAARAIRAGLGTSEILVALPADPDPPPAPQVASISPAEGPFGTTVTLTGSGFGNDPARVGITLSHGRMQHPAATSVSDTTITFVAPDGIVPPYDYPLCMFRGFQDGYVWVTIAGQESSGGYFRYTGLAPCQPIPIYSPFPAIASPGDEVSLYGIGFSPDPADNLVDFAGTQVVATSYAVDELLAYDGNGTIKFTIPADAAVGPVTVRVKRLDGVGPWQDAPPMEVRLPTVPTVDAGEETAGLFLPVAAWDLGFPSEGSMSYPTSWVLGGSNLSRLRQESGFDDHLWVHVTTAHGSATFSGAVLSDDRVVVSIDPSTTTMFNGLKAGDSVTVAVSGYELYNYKVRTSAPVSIPVRANFEVGRVLPVNSQFRWFSAWQRPVKLARGTVLYLRPDDPYDVLVAPGIFDGSLVFNRTGDPEPSFALRDQIQGRAFTMDTLGRFTITNTTTGDSLELSVEEEGAEGWAAYPASTGEAKRLGVDGARFGCGGVLVTIPPGALPDHDGTGGAYAITCSHALLQNAPGLPQLTAGTFGTAVKFTPEPPRTLKPITIDLPYAAAGRATEPEVGLMDPSTGLYATLPAVIDAAGSTVRLTLPAQEWKAVAQASSIAPPSAAPAFALPAPAAASSDTGPAPDAFPQVSLNQATGNVGVFSWVSEKGTLTDADRRIQVNYVSTPGASGYVTDGFADVVMLTLQATYDKLTKQGWAKPDGWLGGWVVVTISDMGPPSGVQGSTTKGVFGQPWVTINSQLDTASAALKTTTAHEMGHVMQRQYTTNLVLNWIDEASANWVAVETLGSAADISTDINGALDFPNRSFPGTFNTGYNDSEAYAAGAWAVWLDERYPGSILRLYQALYGNPVSWGSAWGALADATGASMGSLTADFATAYWTQALDILTALSLTHQPATLDGNTGVTVTDSRPVASSNRIDVSVTAGALGLMSGLQLVARGSGMGDGQVVEVYADSRTCNAPASLGMMRVALLRSGEPTQVLGTPSAGCLRVVLTNFSEVDAATLGVTLVAPRIMMLSPQSGRNQGGYSVAISGIGFGKEPGQVTISGFPLTVTSWSDAGIVVTMLNAGTALGDWDVRVTTKESVPTNTSPFTFTN